MKNSFLKYCFFAYLFGIIMSTSGFAANRELLVKITWTSGVSRTDFDMFVTSPDGKICNYGGEGGKRDQSEWGCVHLKDDMGSQFGRSFEAFRIDLDKMDEYATKNNLLGTGDANKYKFMISRYSGPNIDVLFSYDDSGICSVDNSNDCSRGKWINKVNATRVTNALFAVQYVPQQSPYSENIDLRKSRWNQPRQQFDFSDGSQKTYALGCTAVAVGQVINYYLKSGFKDGWLDVMGRNIVVYPRFEDVMSSWTYSGLGLLNEYSYRNDADVTNFLIATAYLLDSNFVSGGAGVGLYSNEPSTNLVWDDKIESLLEDRFRFDARSFAISKDQNPRGLYAYYLKAKIPPILGMTLVKHDGAVVRHAVVMDGYRVSRSSGKSEFRINFGWGESGPGSCSDKWFPFDTNSLDLSCDGRFSEAWIDGLIAAQPSDNRPITP